jgi:AAA ATPase domain/Adenylate and Guanylate cyclase catalytic domain
VRSIATGGEHVEYTPIGHSTNLASRMQAVAPVGSIAVAEPTRKLCEGYFTLRSLGLTKVKGLSDPVNVYEVLGPGPLRTKLQRAIGRGLTKFVGRVTEMEALKHALEEATAGHGQIVAAIAEPGVGKSRLFFEFKAISQSGCMVIETFSVPHGKTSAYLPIIDLLHGYFGINPGDDSRRRREKVAGRVVALDRALDDTLPYLFSLLSLTEFEDPLAQMDAQVKKRRTLEAIKRMLMRESLHQPLIVIFEDLHWIDAQTGEFLNLLADSIGTARILLLVNYRPEYSHQWNSKTYYTQLRLDPLSRDSANEMLSALIGDHASLLPLKRLIIEKTEGTPFYMEETVQILLDEGALVRNGAISLTKPLSELKIPHTVQAILASRIDRLPPEAKDLLQTLSIVGSEFPLRLVRQVVSFSDPDLEHMLAELQVAEFIYEQPSVADVEYTFKHALTREVAYNSVLNERRRVLHGQVGDAIEALFASQLDDHISDLAYHFARSSNADKAVRYLTLAGKQSLTRSAFSESEAQLKYGLAWLKTLPECEERDSRELELTAALVQVLQLTQGYSARESVETGQRAHALAERGDNLAQLVRQLSAMWYNKFVSGDHSGAFALADQILALAQREGGGISLAIAYRAQLDVRFYLGDLVRAEDYFARWNLLPDNVRYSEDAGADVIAMGFAALVAWTLGRADAARQRIVQAIAIAQKTKNTYDLAIGRFWECWLCWLLREPGYGEAAATQAVSLCEENGFPFVGDISRTVLGWARAQLGAPSVVNRKQQ